MNKAAQGPRAERKAGSAKGGRAERADGIGRWRRSSLAEAMEDKEGGGAFGPFLLWLACGTIRELQNRSARVLRKTKSSRRCRVPAELRVECLALTDGEDFQGNGQDARGRRAESEFGVPRAGHGARRPLNPQGSAKSQRGSAEGGWEMGDGRCEIFGNELGKTLLGWAENN